MDALEELRPELDARGIVFALARAKQELYADLSAVGFVERVGVDWNFMTLPTAPAGVRGLARRRARLLPEGAPPDV